MELFYGDDYCDKFSTDSFLDEYWGGDGESTKFNLSAAHEMLHDKRLTGHRFLDLGCGPSICGIITTPDQFTDIVMADISPANLTIIRNWMNGAKMHFQWEPVFRFTAELEGAKDVSAWVERKSIHIKKSVKDLVHCDVTRGQPLGAEFKPVDVIFTSFCLGCAAKSLDEYTHCLKNVSNLLCPSGFLIIRGALNSSAYEVGGKRFHHLALSNSDVKDALNNANFELLEYKSESFDMPKCGGADGYGVYVLLARKK